MFFVFSRPSTMLLLVAMVIYAALGLGFLNTTGLVGEVAWNWMDERSLLHHPTHLPPDRWGPLVESATRPMDRQS